MQRNQITTLEQLRNGDRFTFIRKDEVWQKTGAFGSQVTFNKFTDGGRSILKYDEKKLGKTAVRFIRHTMHVPGEDAFIQDLKQGDTFYMPYSIVKEYRIDSIDCDERKVHCTCTEDGEKKCLGFGTTVTMVSASQTVSV